eukprot:1162222-Prymnesium_polylepis.2
MPGRSPVSGRRGASEAQHSLTQAACGVANERSGGTAALGTWSTNTRYEDTRKPTEEGTWLRTWPTVVGLWCAVRRCRALRGSA